ncbi:hypothetical protein GB937_007180 [Aspergillus fischeri]|nr:hypothetical protein GB937_007180 [Aspergillus fischeri]
MLKTYWTVELEKYPVNEGPANMAIIQPHFSITNAYNHLLTCSLADGLGQLIYPSLRQCFLAFRLLAMRDGRYTEAPDFNYTSRSPRKHHLALTAQEKSCVTLLDGVRNLEWSFGRDGEPKTKPIAIPPPLYANVLATASQELGAQSILYRGDDGVARHWVNCHRLIKESHNMTLYEVTWDSEPTVAKCWSHARSQSYAHDASTYKRLCQLKPEGFEFFASLRSRGKLACSAVSPRGNIMIISMAKGERLDKQSESKRPYPDGSAAWSAITYAQKFRNGAAKDITPRKMAAIEAAIRKLRAKVTLRLQSPPFCQPKLITMKLPTTMLIPRRY